MGDDWLAVKDMFVMLHKVSFYLIKPADLVNYCTYDGNITDEA